MHTWSMLSPAPVLAANTCQGLPPVPGVAYYMGWAGTRGQARCKGAFVGHLWRGRTGHGQEPNTVEMGAVSADKGLTSRPHATDQGTLYVASGCRPPTHSGARYGSTRGPGSQPPLESTVSRHGTLFGAHSMEWDVPSWKPGLKVSLGISPASETPESAQKWILGTPNPESKLPKKAHGRIIMKGK
jgi:hypothetical protein